MGFFRLNIGVILMFVGPISALVVIRGGRALRLRPRPSPKLRQPQVVGAFFFFFSPWDLIREFQRPTSPHHSRQLSTWTREELCRSSAGLIASIRLPGPQDGHPGHPRFNNTQLLRRLLSGTGTLNHLA